MGSDPCRTTGCQSWPSGAGEVRGEDAEVAESLALAAVQLLQERPSVRGPAIRAGPSPARTTESRARLQSGRQGQRGACYSVNAWPVVDTFGVVGAGAGC